MTLVQAPKADMSYWSYKYTNKGKPYTGSSGTASTPLVLSNNRQTASLRDYYKSHAHTVLKPCLPYSGNRQIRLMGCDFITTVFQKNRSALNVIDGSSQGVGRMSFSAPFDDNATIIISTLQNEARAKFNEALRERNHTLNLAAQLRGEGRENIAYIAQVFLRLKQAIHSITHPRAALGAYVVWLRRRQTQASSANLKEFFHEASQGWLELQFALKPLISDIQDVLAATVKPKLISYGYTGHAKDVSTLSGGVINFGGTTNYPNTVTCRYSVEIHYEVYYGGRVLSPYVDNQIIGMDAESILSGLYEGTPWTWLLDYFTNVHDALESYFADYSHLEQYTRYYTLRKSIYNRPSPSIASNALYDIFGDIRKPVTGYAEYITRTVDNASSSVYLDFRAPFMKQLANIGALLTSFATRRR